mgnify:CR=1 FL=1
MPDVKFSQLLTTSPASVAAAAALFTHKGHILGLTLRWDAVNGFTVGSGSAWIQSLGYAVDVPNAISKAGLSLSATTWYHVYLYLNAGVPDIEHSTTAPAARPSARLTAAALGLLLVAIVLALAWVSPVAIWNAQNHWVSFVYQAKHGAGSSWQALHLIRFLMVQALAFGPLLWWGGVGAGTVAARQRV